MQNFEKELQRSKWRLTHTTAEGPTSFQGSACFYVDSRCFLSWGTCLGVPKEKCLSSKKTRCFCGRDSSAKTSEPGLLPEPFPCHIPRSPNWLFTVTNLKLKQSSSLPETTWGFESPTLPALIFNESAFRVANWKPFSPKPRPGFSLKSRLWASRKDVHRTSMVLLMDWFWFPKSRLYKPKPSLQIFEVPHVIFDCLEKKTCRSKANMDVSDLCYDPHYRSIKRPQSPGFKATLSGSQQPPRPSRLKPIHRRNLEVVCEDSISDPGCLSFRFLL